MAGLQNSPSSVLLKRSTVGGARKNQLSSERRIKGSEDGNYRPIACLPTTFELLMGFIAKHVYGHLDRNDLPLDDVEGTREVQRISYSLTRWY